RTVGRRSALCTDTAFGDRLKRRSCRRRIREREGTRWTVPGLPETPFRGRLESMGRPSKFAPEVLERAVRMVLEHGDQYDSQWTAIRSIASKIGCASESPRRWVVQAERDLGKRPGLRVQDDGSGRDWDQAPGSPPA